MKWMGCILLGMVLLGTCGPAQDTPSQEDAATRVARGETVFNGAYQNLDAAVIERLLADEYAIVYTGQSRGKDRTQFVDELAQLRLVFPELRIAIDSSRVTAYQDQFIVQGIRTFHWRARGEPGIYQERFTNRWRRTDGKWLMTHTQIDPIQ